jgi:hypothetical protein
MGLWVLCRQNNYVTPSGLWDRRCFGFYNCVTPSGLQDIM